MPRRWREYRRGWREGQSRDGLHFSVPEKRVWSGERAETSKIHRSPGDPRTRDPEAEVLRHLSALSLPTVPEFCDVALPVPLDTAFSYRVPDGMEPAIGGRVLVPFRQQRMSGIVVELHDRKPAVQTKNVVSVLDLVPVLDEQLMRLGKWIADYYLAP